MQTAERRVATKVSARPASAREATPVESELSPPTPLPREIPTADEPATDPVASGDAAAADRPVTEQPTAPIPSQTTPAPDPAVEDAPAPVAAPVREDPPVVVPDSRVKPRYPLAARRARVGGTVVMQVAVRHDGSVDRVSVVDDPAPTFGLGQAAAAAVRRWRFEPGRRDGRPVDSMTVVRVNFEPN